MLKLSIDRKAVRHCAGISRRSALRVGAGGLISGLTLPRILELQAKAALPTGAKAKSCIFLFLEGGPPHQDMWDPKPDAPSEYSGPFKAISTNVPGTFVTDQLPLCSQMADKYTIVRSHSHDDGGHTTGYHLLMTGHKAAFADGDNPVPNNAYYPSLGSVVSRSLGSRGPVPSYINLPHPMAAGGPGFYGTQHAPFVIDADPSQPDFAVRDLFPSGPGSSSRQRLRNQLLSGIDQLERVRNHGPAEVLSKYYERAYSLISSPNAKRAFDIKEEPDEVRQMYGHTQLGQCALLARRLVESGCRFVGVDAPGWDVHFNCFPSLRTDLIPYADRAFSGLITDLERRGLLDETLVVMMGEMGRTPKINAGAGRDHWSMAQSIVFAGGGTQPGRVIGATDEHAAAPVTQPVTVNDVLRTITTLLGIDPDRVYWDPLGRPVPVVADGGLIENLV
ncbi:MAG: hypothetical protein CMJ81_21760 [Planctomycetaceae bacterium]|nr:hypothetical protein [Planctomycetaceae bacterium]MBP60862.1 hypothetical protein [Planctomycetaceae bacterium]